ncbi:hypothetical protein OF364_01535 [Mycoplasma enhydrae]|uniref:hypothetical protein n=1 Tax=Mycoplasma enhydrae TaxID=2499220 RepID=UPI00197C0693|nr:hypothetical protein [Mycoplasma enhydrae]MBN4089310.1 hypothetical protein [Mycoplasma enhydrae]MCV3733911.1 hypothetical protein [Mycoplasma enhydrae]MCV3753494.1 hypothetical protein [Mycoplasma enhydrae]
MTNIFENKIRILKEFIDICNQNDIWYSLDENSLLALKNDLSYWNETDHYDVMMTFESYEKLRRLFPDKIIDSVKHSDYFSLQNKFVQDIKEIYNECPFININLIIPTTTKKAKKFVKCPLKIKSYINHYASMTNTKVASIKSKIRLAKTLKGLTKSFNYKDVVDLLYDQEQEGFLVTSALINRHSLRKWITNISYKLITINKGDLEIKIISEYANYLRNIYGKNWASIDNLATNYLHCNIIDVDKYDTIQEQNEI